MGLFRKKKSKKSKKRKSGSCNASGFCSKSCNGGNCANVLSAVNTNQQSMMSVSPAGATKTFLVGKHGVSTNHAGVFACVADQSFWGGSKNSSSDCECSSGETPKILGISDSMAYRDGNRGTGVFVTVGCFPT